MRDGGELFSDSRRFVVPAARGRFRAGRTGISVTLSLAMMAVIAVCGWAISCTPAVSQTPARGTSTGLALPRFASLKASRVNLRKGPGLKYPTAWVFKQAGLPVEIIAESEAWRQVRDAEGTKGWVLRTLLSARRTVQVLPWDVKPDTARPQVSVTTTPSTRSSAVAMVEAGVVADIHRCDGQWCLVGVSGFRGYISQQKLWGVYAGETVR